MSCREDDSSLTICEILLDHFKQYPSFQLTDEDSTVFNSVHVRRNHVWRDAFRAITKPSFNPTNPVCITFVGKPAVDEGGPRREFFTLALSCNGGRCYHVSWPSTQQIFCA